MECIVDEKTVVQGRWTLFKSVRLGRVLQWLREGDCKIHVYTRQAPRQAPRLCRRRVHRLHLAPRRGDAESSPGTTSRAIVRGGSGWYVAAGLGVGMHMLCVGGVIPITERLHRRRVLGVIIAAGNNFSMAVRASDEALCVVVVYRHAMRMRRGAECVVLPRRCLVYSI